MILNMIGGGGGAALNFKVVGGTSAPSNPTENTIWVNTDTAITSWIFSATEPETPAEGMVWISVGSTSSVEFNALKKNGIQVYPLTAKQYVGAAWVDKTAQNYQNGEWRDFALIIFDGTTVAEGYSFARVNSSGTVSGSVVFGDDYVEMGTAIGTGALVVQQPIDVTDRTTIEVTVKWSNNGSSTSWRRVALKTSLTNGTTGTNWVASSGKLTGTDITTVTIDVSALSGELYLLVAHYNESDNGTTTKARIYSVRVY